MKEKGGFDNVAGIYDTLSFLVFGNDLRKAQQSLLDELPAKGVVLIIGGGAGWILGEVLSRRPELVIHYVEASEKMLDLSKTQVRAEANVTFIHGTEQEIPGQYYDCIITNFFLDVFAREQLLPAMTLMKEKLKATGVWFCTDFRDSGKHHHRFLIWLMHRFFRLFASLEANRLLDFRSYFADIEMVLSRETIFRKGLIFSSVYRPKEPVL